MRFISQCVLFSPCGVLGMCDTPSSKPKNLPYKLGLQTFAMQNPKTGIYSNIVTFLVEKIVLIYPAWKEWLAAVSFRTKATKHEGGIGSSKEALRPFLGNMSGFNARCDILGSGFCGAGKLTVSCPTKLSYKYPPTMIIVCRNQDQDQNPSYASTLLREDV